MRIPVGPACNLGDYARRRMTFLYALRCEETGRIKIGKTASPTARWKQLGLQSSTRITLLCSCPTGGHSNEQIVHRALAPHRTHGEWYEPTGAVMRVVDAIRDGGIEIYYESPLLRSVGVATGAAA